MSIKKLLKQMVDQNASDLFYRAGGSAHLRLAGKVIPVDSIVLSVDDVMDAVAELTTPKQRDTFRDYLDVDFAVYIEELNHRFRVSIFRQRNWPSMVIRNVRSDVQTFEDLNLPAETLKKLSLETRGLVLLTGAGNWKKLWNAVCAKLLSGMK